MRWFCEMVRVNTSRASLGRRSRQILRELVICIAMPAMVLISADVVAQKQQSQDTAVSASQASDNALADQINSKLMASDTLRPLDLGVWVHGGVATLSGTVPNESLKSQADALVKGIAGVQSVDDEMRIGAVAATAPGFPAGQPNAAQSKVGQPNAVPPGPPSSSSNGAPIYGEPQGSPSPGAPPQNSQSRTQPLRSYQMVPQTQMGPQTQPVQRLIALPPGTVLSVMMLQTVDSHHTRPGTAFRGVLVRDIALSNRVIAVPRGAYVEGKVIDARPPGHLKGRPKLALQLSSLDVGHATYVLNTDTWARQGPGKGAQSANEVAASAGAGAIAGAIVGGGPVALLGAAIGGLGGAGLAALHPGAHLVVPAESIVTFRLDAPLSVREPTPSEVRTLADNLLEYGNGGGYYRRRGPDPYIPPGAYRAPYPAAPPPPPVPGEPVGGYPY